MSGKSLNSPTNKSEIENELEFIAMFSQMSESALDVREIIAPGDFCSSAVRKCYEYLLHKYDKDGGYVPEDMLNFVRDSNGEEALNSIKFSIKNVISLNREGLMSRARRIRQNSLFRQVQKIALDITYTTPETVMEVVEESLQKLAMLTEEPAEETMLPIQDTLIDYLNKKYSGTVNDIIPTKYSILDRMLPMSKGDLIIIAARPSVGKSAFVSNLAVKFSFQGYRTALFSLEMSREQVTNRILASIGQIPHEFLVRNRVEGRYVDDLGRASNLLFEKCSLCIDDKSCMNVNEIKRKAIKEKAQVIIIDYLQLMKPCGGRRYSNKVDEISEITRDLKILAGELKVPIILLSQLNRLVETRNSPRPVLSDLRDSGSIEQDANSVIFLSKLEPDNNCSNILVDIAKNRSGETGQIIYQFYRDTQTFRETERKYEPPKKGDRVY